MIISFAMLIVVCFWYYGEGLLIKRIKNNLKKNDITIKSYDRR